MAFQGRAASHSKDSTGALWNKAGMDRKLVKGRISNSITLNQRNMFTVTKAAHKEVGSVFLLPLFPNRESKFALRWFKKPPSFHRVKIFDPQMPTGSDTHFPWLYSHLQQLPEPTQQETSVPSAEYSTIEHHVPFSHFPNGK